MKVDYSLRGFNELMARLIELREDVGKKVVYRAAGSAARVVRNAARENARAAFKDSTVLVRNIVVGRSKEFTPPVVAYNVGVRHGTRKQRKEDNDPFYWWHWEFGHHNQFTRQYERRPFMIPALENNKIESLQAMEKVVAAAVKRVEAQAK